MGLFAWTNTSRIGQASANFEVSILAAALAGTSLVISSISYFLIPAKYNHFSAFIGYAFLLGAVGSVTAQTGTSDSPFLALWMVASVFSGIFGAIFSFVLLIMITGVGAWALLSDALSSNLVLGIALAGYLPVMISYLLWHGKAKSESNGSKSYYDLASELDQVSNKAEAVINAINDGVIAVSNQGNIELMNPAAQRIVGWGHQDALHLNYKSVLQLLAKDGSDVTKSNDPVFETLTSNQPVKRNNLQLQTSAGKRIDIDIFVQPLGRAGSGAIIVFSDVTKERAEENAQAEFISTASHEMRTPVASIEGYLGLALNPNTAQIDDKAREFITKAHNSAKHLGQLFQDLLGVTKAEDGRMRNDPKVVDMVMFTSEIVEGLRPKAEEKKLTLFFKPSIDDAGGPNIKPVFFVNVDPDHLREVLNNLVENAIKYTREGEVVIDVRGDHEHVLVTITDSGIGIPAEDIPHLFQKFYRVDNSDTREIGGTGLGLYLCRRLVELMDGRIWVESEYKKGSTFSIEFNRISHEEANRLIEIGSAQKTIDPDEARKDLDAQLEKGKQSASKTAPATANSVKAQTAEAKPTNGQTQGTPSAHRIIVSPPTTNDSKPSSSAPPVSTPVSAVQKQRKLITQTMDENESNPQKAKTLHPLSSSTPEKPVAPTPQSAPVAETSTTTAPSAPPVSTPAQTPQTQQTPAATAPKPVETPPAPSANQTAVQPPKASPPTTAESPAQPRSIPVAEHREQPQHLSLEVPDRK